MDEKERDEVEEIKDEVMNKISEIQNKYREYILEITVTWDKRYL